MTKGGPLAYIATCPSSALHWKPVGCNISASPRRRNSAMQREMRELRPCPRPSLIVAAEERFNWRPDERCSKNSRETWASKVATEIKCKGYRCITSLVVRTERRRRTDRGGGRHRSRARYKPTREKSRQSSTGSTTPIKIE